MPRRTRHLYGHRSPLTRSLDPAEAKQAIFSFILQYSADEGYAPTVREITAATNLLSTATTQKFINELVAEGRLERSAKRTRTLRVVL